MSGIFDQIGQAFYEDVVGRKETNVEYFGLLDAWKFFIDIAVKDKHVKGCVVDVKKQGSRFIIQQIALNKDSKPLKKGNDFYVGREVKADNLDDDIVEYMNGETTKILRIDTLRK